MAEFWPENKFEIKEARVLLFFTLLMECKSEKEVVLMIPEVEDAKKVRMDSKNDFGSSSFSKDSETKHSDARISNLDRPKSKTYIASSSPEIAKASEKPPRLPTETLTRPHSISRSVISKPKSRFVEQSYPTAVNLVEAKSPPVRDRAAASPYRDSPKENPKTPKTPSTAAEEDDEYEEEIYRAASLPQTSEKMRKRISPRVLIELNVLVAAMGCLIASLTIRRLQNFMIWGLEIWKSCLMVIVIFCGRLVTDYFIRVLVFLIELNFLLKKKVLYFVYGLKKSVQVCIWLGLVLLTWSLLFNRKVQRSTNADNVLNYVSRALISLLIGAFIWLVKTLAMKFLASSFHVNTFFDRIQESIFHQYVLMTLSGPPVMELAEKVGPANSTGQLSFRTAKKGNKGEEQEFINVGKLHRMKHEKVSAWTMKRLINTISSTGLSTISNTIDESVDDETGEGKDKEITSEWEARLAAFRIFQNVAKPHTKYIDEEDLLRFLSKDELENVLPQFAGAVETRRIKKSALRNWVVKVYLERKSLAHSLNDTKTAVNQLNKLASGIVIIVDIIIWLLLMGFATTKVLLFISSQMVLVVFMFGNTCKTIFEAIIFVFVMHPFDVGDRCVIDGVQMTVEEMNILTTIFLRFDNEKICYPNAVLATKPISNFYRSPDMTDSVEFSIHVSTSMETIAALKSRIKLYIDSKPQHWHPNHRVVVKEIEDVNKLKMALLLNHTMNFQNMGEKMSRRSEVIFELKKIFEELNIRYHLLPQEIHLSYIGSTAIAPVAIGR